MSAWNEMSSMSPSTEKSSMSPSTEMSSMSPSTEMFSMSPSTEMSSMSPPTEMSSMSLSTEMSSMFAPPEMPSMSPPTVMCSMPAWPEMSSMSPPPEMSSMSLSTEMSSMFAPTEMFSLSAWPEMSSMSPSTEMSSTSAWPEMPSISPFTEMSSMFFPPEMPSMSPPTEMSSLSAFPLTPSMNAWSCRVNHTAGVGPTPVTARPTHQTSQQHPRLGHHSRTSRGVRRAYKPNMYAWTEKSSTAGSTVKSRTPDSTVKSSTPDSTVKSSTSASIVKPKLFTSTPHSVILQEDLDRLRHDLAVNKAGRDALANVFMWLYRGTFPVVTYLTQDLGYTNAQYKRVFDAHQRDKLEVSSDAATFDINLLYKLLQRICGLAEVKDPTWITEDPQKLSLESLIYRLKQHRNTFIYHRMNMKQQSLSTTLTKFRDLLVKMLAEAGARCGTSSQNVQQATRAATEYIDGLMAKVREPLNPLDVVYLPQLHQENKLLDSQITEMVKQNSKQELTSIYTQCHLYMDSQVHKTLPAPGILLNITYDLSRAFTRLQVLEDPATGVRPSHVAKGQDSVSSSHTAQGHGINYEDILSVRQDNESVPQCVLLTGEGGMGKTTLLKLILEKWVEDPAAIRHLGTVDLVFYVQCRDLHLNTFDGLLRQLLPQTLHDSDLDFEQFKNIILSLNILVLIDGYDEVNDHSGRLVKELLHLPGKDVRLVITTRPGWDQHLSQLVPHTRPRCNILVLGITPERRVEFAERTIKVLVEEESQRSVITGRFTQRLEQMSQFLGEYLNTPLTLTLLALLCVEAPEEFNNLTTNTQVYEKIHDFITSKLVSRLTDKHVTDPKGKCDFFLSFFEEVCLRGIKRKEYDLWPETEAEIREKCDTLGLPQEEVLSTYFIRTRSHRRPWPKQVFSYFHARYQEYCAGRGLVAQLVRAEGKLGDPTSHKESRKSETNTNLVRDVLLEDKNTTIGEIFNETRYQCILLNATSVLSNSHFEHKFASQVIDIVNFGETVEELLKHVAESRGSEHVIQAVCKKLKELAHWKIKSVGSYAVLPIVLRRVMPDSIYLGIESRPQSSQLQCVLGFLKKQQIYVNMCFYGQYFCRNGDLSDTYLETVTAPGSKCILEIFEGCLSEAAIPLLPLTLRCLTLRLTQQQLLVLIDHLPHLRHINNLSIRLEAERLTHPAKLSSLPYKGRGLELTIVCSLTDDSPDVDWCCHLARQLCPLSKKLYYPFLSYQGTDLTSVGVENLLRGLDREGVTTNNLLVEVTDYLSLEEDHRLRDLARSFGILGFQVTWTGRRTD
ncbi:uncharacterized protein [Procambarus clarkii]|uniref:uncharacterized protein n=1 Tax=Procambarus clarkii TaxID=6728 RepID=UPI003743052A